MVLLLFSVAVVLLVSAACSISEASLYAVRMAYVRKLAESGRRAGRLLTDFKQNMERPITAILIVNTAANTAGAAVAGSQAREVLGSDAVLWFSAVFTLAVLVFAEIVPKVTGVAYARIVAPAMSLPLRIVVGGLYPAVRLSAAMARLIKPEGHVAVAPEEEVRQFAALSAEEGSILPEEADLVGHVLSLNDVTAGQIMTPRSVVFKVSSSARVRDLATQASNLQFSRIPVYSSEDPDNWLGVVFRRDILAQVLRGQRDTTMADLTRPFYLVPETTPGNELLARFLTSRRHLAGVTDEFGHIIGIVTLEDVLESLIGEEIVDETDTVIDMREEAKRKQPGPTTPDDRGDSTTPRP